MKRIRITKLLTGIAIAAATPASLAQDHPFELINVIDLFELHSIESFDEEFDPVSEAPSNFSEYSAAPRIGTNPGTVATDGTRAWVGGFYNGVNYSRFGNDDATNRVAWYAATGVAEVLDITTASGFADGTFIRYLDTFQVGPGLTATDWISGMDYDPTSKILYITYDANEPLLSFSLPEPGLPWQTYETYIAAVDADPESPTYSQILWQKENPFAGDDNERIRAGVAVDPLAPNWVGVPRQGLGRIEFFDANNPFDDPISVFITDADQLGCNSTAFRGHDFHPETGDWFGRVLNGIQYVPRDTSTQIAPFGKFPRFIVEPDDGNGTVDTTAAEDDEQLEPVGSSASAGEQIIGVGPNGVLDTVPAGDDVFSANALITERIVSNSDPGSSGCDEDPDGFPAGNNAQAQALAIIPGTNLANATEDLLLANNRPFFGSGMETELWFFNTAGDRVAELLLPCAPTPPDDLGIQIYGMDYDAASGTLVVVEFERRLLFVYKAETIDGPPVAPFDFTRNGALNLADFAGFQTCFTGDAGGDLSLNCLRMNSDADCDVDVVDFASWEAAFLAEGGV